LTLHDYDQILGVLDDCSGARSPDAFREMLLESLASRFSYRHCAMLIGPTRDYIFKDRDAHALSGAQGVVPSYIEHFHSVDPLAQLAARSASGPRPLVLDDALPHLTDQHRLYLDGFLYPAGFHAVLATEWAGTTAHAGLALFAEEEGAFRARDITLIKRLGPTLARQLDLLTQLPQPLAWMAQLTPRETQMAQLVREGCTNREIAAALHVTTDTVKKHVKAACLKANAANRAGLAARTSGHHHTRRLAGPPMVITTATTSPPATLPNRPPGGAVSDGRSV
jgi:DNA-binding CsgD family transcriptional regulator